jgi:hypothetical protein
MANRVIPAQYRGASCLLFQLIGADMNVTTDQIFQKIGDFGEYFIDEIRVENASANLNAADGGIYDAASKGGNAVVAATQVYTDLTTAALGMNCTIAAAGLQLLSAKNLYLSLTGTDGEAATADFYVFGRVMS